MAKKGQCFNSYNEDLKEEIVNAYFNNQGGVKSLGKKYGISYQTITNWVQKKKKGIDLKDKHYLKGRKKDPNIDYKERYEILKKYQAFLKAQRERK
jgi:transposase-like protein